MASVVILMEVVVSMSAPVSSPAGHQHQLRAASSAVAMETPQQSRRNTFLTIILITSCCLSQTLLEDQRDHVTRERPCYDVICVRH